MGVFEGPVERLACGPLTPEGDMDLIRDRLAGLRDGAPGSLRLFRPYPTAAFSRRDSLRPGYERAQQAVAAQGFAPVLRPAGGHLAIYNRDAVVVDLIARPGETQDPMKRFAIFADALAKALGSIGVDTTIAPLPDEYCPGTYSLQAGGRKVAGLAQRQTKHGFHMGGVVMVGPVDAPRAAMAEAYDALDLPMNPETVGGLSDIAPGVTCDAVSSALLQALGQILDDPATLPPL